MLVVLVGLKNNRILNRDLPHYIVFQIKEQFEIFIKLFKIQQTRQGKVYMGGFVNIAS